MHDDFPSIKIVTTRSTYAKRAASALGALAVLIVMAIWLGVPTFGAFSFDQIIWGVAIFILLLSLPDFAIALLVLVRPTLIAFHFNDDGVRVAGAAPIPWQQIVSFDVVRDDDVSALQLVVRPPAPNVDWLAWRVYGLRTMPRAGLFVYGIARDRVAATDGELMQALENVARRLARA